MKVDINQLAVIPFYPSVVRPKTGTIMNQKVNEWFNNLSEPQRMKLSELRQLILDKDRGFSEEIKRGQPCYSVKKVVCYLQKSKEHVTIGFQQGARLEDINELLVGEGKDMRHVNISLTEEIDRSAIANLVSDAVEFDRN